MVLHKVLIFVIFFVVAGKRDFNKDLLLLNNDILDQ